MELEKAVNYACSQLGYAKLTPSQEEVVLSVLQGQDIFVSLPTGSGKSLCYAVLPMAHDNYRSVHVSTPPDGGSPAASQSFRTRLAHVFFIF